MTYMDEYNRWLENAVADKDIITELRNMPEDIIEDAFYRNLTFGTGGLRGIIGAGTNRINIYTVAKASQGLANYLISLYGKNARVVIGYDSRIKSELFAKTAASVFTANGIIVDLWPALSPVPTVSFAVRHLKASAGIMITASHNPARYNGYKVYGKDGCQITTKVAAEIFIEIEKIDIFSDIKTMGFDNAVREKKIRYIKREVLEEFIKAVKSQSVLFGEEVDTNVKIIYSPLNGTGYVPVTKTLSEMGYTNITIVEEQRLPDGNFPTCPYPNPEAEEAMKLGIEYAIRENADLFLATDPDCDRVGIAVKNNNGEYVLLSGNETGILLLDYICSQRIKHGRMPVDPVMIKTVVTMDMATRIAANYGVKTIDVLTGFKFIGEQISILEKRNKAESYIFGFEESYGYLSGGYIRDKDGVGAAYLICEMFAYYKTHGISLLDKLQELFDQYGYCLNTLHSYEFEGSIGIKKMQNIMQNIHKEIKIGNEFVGKRIIKIFDYNKGINNLPKSDVLKWLLEDDCSVVVRPSGTEPKLKVYISVSADTKSKAEKIEKNITEKLNDFFSNSQ